MAISISAAAAQALASALATDIGSGAIIDIRSGSKPATPETTATGTLLASVTLTGSFTASGGTLTAADPAAASVIASGTAGWFRIKTSGSVGKADGTVGTSGADMNLSSVALVSGGSVDLSTVSLTLPVA